MPNILIACTGSVATVKLENLVKEFKKHKAVEIKVISTKSSLHFIPKNLEFPILTDEDEWKTWGKMGDEVLHISLRKWADILLIAPLSANTLAKIANGLCDNLVTSVVRAWDMSKQRWLCPAMNTHMFTHPFTKKHLDICRNELGFGIIGPVEKLLACGDLGIGGMSSVEEIVERVMSGIQQEQ